MHLRPILAPVLRHAKTAALGIMLGVMFAPVQLFSQGEPGAHFEAYNPDTLLKRRNLLTWSEDFSNAAWSKTRSSITANAAIAPDGTMTADKLIEDTTAAQDHRVSAAATAVTAGDWRTSSVYLKAAERTSVSIFTNIEGGTQSFRLNLLTGAVTNSGMPRPPVVENAGSGWWRVSVSQLADATSATALAIYVVLNDGAFATVYTGDGASGVYIWGAQFEKASAPTPYQKVTDWTTEYLAAAGDRIGMWQDDKGTTPVTAVEQPVGFWRDTKQGAALGAALVSDGGNELGLFNGRVDGVAVQRGVLNWSAEQAHSGTRSAKYTCTDATVGDHLPGIVSVNAGVPVDVVVWVYNPSGNFSGLKLIDVSDGSWESASTTVKDQWVMLRGARPAKSALWTLAVGNQGSIAGSGFVFYFDDISVRTLPGNHATQGTSASRPTLSARYNKYRNTEGMSTLADWSCSGQGVASVPVVTGGFTGPGGRPAFRVQIALNGGTTATDFAQMGQPNIFGGFVNGVAYKTRFYVRAYDAGNVGKKFASRHAAGAAPTLITLQSAADWQLVEFSEVGNSVVTSCTTVYLRGDAGTADSIDLLVCMPDLRSADDWALSLPLYQRVGNTGSVASDYDTEGFPHYLKFDGVDDSLATANIDFSSVDKVTVWAGVTKLSDAANGTICEFGIDSSVAGAFNVFGPVAGINPYRFNSRGTVAGSDAGPTTGYAAPSSAVLTGQGNISGDSTTLRINGALAASNATDQGAGNYTAQVLYIGRRQGATNPFNGRLYSLTVRGSTTPASEAFIAKMERYAARLMQKALA